MRALILILTTIFLFSFRTHSQISILEQLNVTDRFNYFSLVEYGDNYYFFTNQTAGPLNVFFNQKATQYILNKYNKITHQLVASVYIAGDTVQNDSIVSSQAYMIMLGKNIHVNYVKRRRVGSETIFHNHYLKLDTAFDILVPDKKYTEVSGWLSSGGFAAKQDGGCIMGYFTSPDIAGGTSKYVILDSMGIVTGNDTIGAINAAGYHPSVLLRELIALPDHTYIATGMQITGGFSNGINFGWVKYSNDMQQLDTFNYKTGLELDSEAYTKNALTPRIIGLPSGSLISANSAPPSDFDPWRAYPRIVKHTAATRFGVDDYISFPPVDPTDTAHGNYSAIRSIAYNSFDNNLYYADITHMSNSGSTCAYNSEKSFLEIISVDTNLNFRWRKFIKMQGNCTYMGTVSVPDGRNGILVAGRSFQEADIEKEWAYYINDDTPSDNPTNINDIDIKKEDGFVLYPVPAEDEVNLISLDKEFKEATLYDLSGRLLFTQSIISGRAVINTSQISPGIYMVKATDKKGNTFQKKMVKR